MRIASLTQLICSETDRIRDLVDRMEVFGDERPLAKEPVNIHDVLDHVRRLAENGFGRGMRFIEDYDPSLPFVPGNRDKLVQAFLNLVKNAAEAIGDNPEQGRIVMQTSFRPGVRLSVPGSDTRISLPLMIRSRTTVRASPTHLKPHLFDPFVTTKRDGHRPRSRTRRQDHRRSRRHHRVRQRAQAHRIPRAAADAGHAPRVQANTLRGRRTTHGPGHHPDCRRRYRHPHGSEPGVGPCRLRAARHRQCRDAVALGGAGRGRRRHHRRRDARRERLRPHPAHQEAPARSAHHRDERAEHADDGADGGREGRLRVSAEALRSQRGRRRRRARAVRSPTASAEPLAERDGRRRGAAADRPLARRCRRSTASSRA